VKVSIGRNVTIDDADLSARGSQCVIQIRAHVRIPASLSSASTLRMQYSRSRALDSA
jgi:hypothetical protein